MSIRNRKITIRKYFAVVFLVLVFACSQDLTDDPIPYTPFEPIEILLSLPEYSALNADGGRAYVNSGGVRGIILYRLNASTFFAYERNCSYRPADACATVNTGALFMEDSCCGSTFNYEDGKPNGGPAWRPLQQYTVSKNGNLITITDEIVES